MPPSSLVARLHSFIAATLFGQVQKRAVSFDECLLNVDYMFSCSRRACNSSRQVFINFVKQQQEIVQETDELVAAVAATGEARPSSGSTSREECLLETSDEESNVNEWLGRPEVRTHVVSGPSTARSTRGKNPRCLGPAV